MVQKNHLTVGRIANGAIVEKEVNVEFNNKEEILFSMKKSDFTTAKRISQKINDSLKDVYASVVDARSIKVNVPPEYTGSASLFVTELERLDVDPDVSAKVIIDERTGTVVMGENVRLSTVAVAHGALFIEIKEEPVPVQPPPLAPESSQTAIAQRTRLRIEEGRDKLLVVPKGISLGEVVSALNSIGVTPRDLIAILQAIKASGSLHAEIEIL